MEVVTNNYMPGDPRLVEQLLYELKSQGIFDQFRKECIADVDTKPAYQNLRQRVEGSVASFLKEQTWRPDMNKNQVREQLRKNIYESGYLETGVERIVDQVVNPKINTIFLPQVEDVVYRYLGIEKPNRLEVRKELKIDVTDLLPTDLEAISPESDHTKDDSMNDSFNTECKLEEDESPAFEPIDVQRSSNIQLEENSIDSHLSGFSGLQSHDSNPGMETKMCQMELSNQDSQVSQNSSDSRLSIITSEDNTKMEIQENSELKLLKSSDSNSLMEISPSDTQMTSDSNSIQKDEVLKVVEETESNNDSNGLDEKSIIKAEEQEADKKIETIKNKDNDEKLAEDKKYNDKKSDDKKSRSSSKHNSKDKKDDKYRKSSSSSSRDKEKNSSKHSSSSSSKDKNKSKDKRESKSSYSGSKDKDKGEQENYKIEKDNNYKIEKDKDNHKERDKDNHKERDRDNHKERDKDNHKERDKDHNKEKDKDKLKSERDKDKIKSEKERDRKDKEKAERDRTEKDKSNRDKERSGKDKGKSSTSSSGSKHSTSKEKDKNSSEKPDSSKKDKEKSSSSSKSKSSHSDSKAKSSSSEKSKKDSNSSSSSKHSGSSSSSKKDKDKKRDSKKDVKDDHYSSKEKKNDRRSTDRDSNDGRSGRQSQINSFTESNSSQAQKSSQESSNSNSGSGSGDSGNSDQNEHAIKSPIKTVEQSGNQELPISYLDIQKFKYTKPKFASNFEEARKLMKIRKQLAKMERHNQLSLAQIEVSMEVPMVNGMNCVAKDSINDVIVDKNVEKDNVNKVDVIEEPKTPEVMKQYEIAPKNNATVLNTRELSQENWEALEARLAQEMSNINYNSYESPYDDYDYAGYNSIVISPRKTSSNASEICAPVANTNKIMDSPSIKPQNDVVLTAVTEQKLEDSYDEKDKAIELEETKNKVSEQKDHKPSNNLVVLLSKTLEGRILKKSVDNKDPYLGEDKEENQKDVIENKLVSDDKSGNVDQLEGIKELESCKDDTKMDVDTKCASADNLQCSDSDSDLCTYLEPMSPRLDRNLQFLYRYIEKLERDVEHSLKTFQNNFVPLKQRCGKHKLAENVDLRNNNKAHYEQSTDVKKRRRSVMPNPNNSMISKANKEKLCNSSDISPNDSFSLPLSPAESDKSIDKREEESPKVKQKREAVGKSINSRSQRYSSEDLYKPRPMFASSRRSRGAKNVEK